MNIQEKRIAAKLLNAVERALKEGQNSVTVGVRVQNYVNFLSAVDVRVGIQRATKATTRL